MMEEKNGVSAWLRGVVDESYGKESRPSCTWITETFFGVKCQKMHTCGSCILTMLTAIADRIDREMMELPKDAEGEPIRIGDVLYSSGNECRVVSITVKADEACVGVHTDEGAFLPSVNPKYLSRKNTEPLEPEPPDSWEKLEKDARKIACDYAPAPRNEDGLTTCDGCPFQKSESCSNEMTIDLVERAKKLAGIEEEARND